MQPWLALDAIPGIAPNEVWIMTSIPLITSLGDTGLQGDGGTRNHIAPPDELSPRRSFFQMSSIALGRSMHVWSCGKLSQTPMSFKSRRLAARIANFLFARCPLLCLDRCVAWQSAASVSHSACPWQDDAMCSTPPSGAGLFRATS